MGSLEWKNIPLFFKNYNNIKRTIWSPDGSLFWLNISLYYMDELLLFNVK